MNFPTLTLDAPVPVCKVTDKFQPVLAPTAERYNESRFRDFMALTREIAEAPKEGSTIDLGYCKLIDHCKVQVRAATFEFRGLAEASAFILRRFW